MPEADVTDEELVRRYRAGDQEAATLLFGRLIPLLRPVIRQKMSPVLRLKVAESDVIQSAFASVFGRLDEFRDGGHGSFRRWLDGVVDHKLIDEMRRYQGSLKRDPRRERALDALSNHSVPRDRGESPSRAAAAREQGQRIRAAIELLAPDHRTVVLMLHERGLDLSEAGRLMDRSPDAVRKLYARAIDRLSEILGTGGAP
jgi:RNA polymerase sigma-70 factor, ECF subfamily